MADFNVVLDPILDEMRAEFDNGSGGGGGSAYVGGNRINIAGGTISFVDTADIQTVSGSSVTIVPNTAYKIYATTSAVTINATPPAAGKWAYEGHLEIFVASTGYIVTGSNVVLANALEPDAVNNCTVRFHDGLAIISVEDHVAGYIVVSATGSTAGTLPYALGSASQEYVAFDATLNGQTLDMGGATTNGEKHVVGNGYTETIVSGGINCTSKTTFANLGMNGVVVSSGTMTLGDVYIPNGATVSVSGGGLAIEKVTGNGGVIDLGGTNIITPNGTTASASGCTFIGGANASSGTDGAGGALRGSGTSARIAVSGTTFTGNSAVFGGAVGVQNSAKAILTDCTLLRNSSTANAGHQLTVFNAAETTLIDCNVESSLTSTGPDLFANGGAGYVLSNSHIGGTVLLRGGSSYMNFTASNTLSRFVYGDNGGGSVTISSGAILDLTGNTNATPIAPGGGVTFAPGGATVYPSAGSASAYTLGGMTVPQIGNTNVVNLSNTNVIVSGGGTAYASGCTFSGGQSVSGSGGGAIFVDYNGNASFVSCIASGNDASDYSGGFIRTNYGSVNLSGCSVFENHAATSGGGLQITSGALTATSCFIKNNTVKNTSIVQDIQLNHADATFTECVLGDIVLTNGGAVTLYGTNAIDAIQTNTPASAGTVTISSGATLDLTGNTAATPIAPGGGVVVDGGCQVITSAGSTVSIAGGTYTQINNDGTTE